MSVLCTSTIMQFVEETCDVPKKLNQVRDLALKIRSELPPDQQPSAFDVSLVALLHHVNAPEQVRKFLLDHNFDPAKIMNCIAAIPFSKEQQYGKRWFEELLMDPYWIMVRDIVSDAAKLTELGKDGAMRYLDHNRALGISGKNGIVLLLQHMQDELLLLRDHIVTEPGRKRAVSAHDELVNFSIDAVLYLLK